MTAQDLPPPIASEAMENLRLIGGGSLDFVEEIVQMFREDTPPRLAELDDCVALGDIPRLAKVAHSLKGAASNFGAQHFRTLAERLEHSAKRGELATVPADCAHMRAEYARILTALEQTLKPH